MASNQLLRDTLRQSLHDVLSEVSLDIDAPASSPALRVPTQFGAPSIPSSAAASVPASTGLSLLRSGAVGLGLPVSVPCQLRPSAATLGLSSDELIRLRLAAAEKRMLENKKMMLDLQRARMNAAIRHQGLLGLFSHQTAGTGAIPQGFAGGFPKTAQEPPKDTLKELGTTLRVKATPYIDVSDHADPDPNDSRIKKTRGGVTTPFPEKLHALLKEIADDGHDDVISFFPHGRAFGIHKPDRFVSEIMPKYFKQSKLSSFNRQLNLYGFKRIASGRDAGGYYHELFLQGRPNLCLHMRRVGLPKGEDRRKMRAKNNAQTDPDFYSMKPVTAGC